MCHIDSFNETIRRDTGVYGYMIDETCVENIETIQYLAVILDVSLTFSKYIGTSVSKANKIMGLIL